MFNIIPLILILASLTVIAVIIAKKFSVLANLDIDSIPAERETKIKEQIIGNRIKRNVFRYSSRVGRIIEPIVKALAGALKQSYNKILDFKENYKKETEINKTIETPAGKEDSLKTIEILVKEEKYEEAEKEYISLIGLDSKSSKAFRALGELYYKKKDYQEAKQTTEHALRLLEKEYEEINRQSREEYGENREEALADINTKIADTFFDLSVICKELDETDNCYSYIDKALAIEPNNPRFLDTKLDLSIIKKDKATALETLNRMEKANPENQKLDDLRKKINELE